MKKRSTHHDDLEWLFWDCESQMGFKSNFNSLILASKYGTKRTRIEDGELVNGIQEDLFNEDTLIDALDTRRALGRMAAASKNRRVMVIYCALPPRAKAVLEAYYEPRRYPPEVREVFGGLAGVLHLTRTAQGIKRFSPAWVASAIVRKDPIVRQLQQEASSLYQGALAAYGRRANQLRAREQEAVSV
ncbi:hypothetical protein WME75_10685 [Sorangium sp. So ce1014]|uniref:hypothetical protein n=1 Tax=Sorangium sp. So ce1014 TaxID=3133326 RepID=UPI003F5EDDF9